MTPVQDQRPRFYEGQYLGAEDLSAAVGYGRIGDARHALGAHTWGIALGLEIRETPRPGGGVDAHVLPGYAWDGFGRPIVLTAPTPIPAALFADIRFDAALDAAGTGRRIEVWLRYDETNTQPPRPGFEICDRAGQFSRVQETFRVEIGARHGHGDRHDPLVVAGQSLDAEKALQQFDPAAPLLYDESVPHQTYPGEGERAFWLIPIGTVRWQPVLNGPGGFVTRAAGDEAVIRAFRRYIGVVAETIHAADGALRLRDRGSDPATSLFQTSTDDLVWVEGNLRVQAADLRLAGGKLDFRTAEGADLGTPLTIRRAGDAGKLPTEKGGRALQIVLGPDAQKDNRFAVGPLKAADNTLDEKLVVLSGGNVGIGTSAPALKLDIRGDFGRNDAAATLHLFGSQIGDKGTGALFLRSGGGVVAFDGNDSVGIGTVAPNRALTVQGAAGTYLNVKGNGGSVEALLGADDNGAIVSAMTNHDLLLRAGVNKTHMVVKTSGNVGIGLNAPVCKLHVAHNLNADEHNVNAHVALIENTSVGANADVLALKIGAGTADDANNFLTFFAGNNPVGSIQGNTTGTSVTLNTTGADFAECLPRAHPEESIEPGDIVGVFDGKITRATAGAQHVAAITDRPIVVGNAPPDRERRRLCGTVALLGQVPVRVRGAVRAGDYILPSGREDGTGVAVSPERLPPERCGQIVGRAWEAVEDGGEGDVRAVNTAIGLASGSAGPALWTLLHAQQAEIAELRAEIRRMGAR